jgi:DNA-directed RNA polymerase subunit RPC12/RpoP
MSDIAIVWCVIAASGAAIAWAFAWTAVKAPPPKEYTGIRVYTCPNCGHKIKGEKCMVREIEEATP